MRQPFPCLAKRQSARVQPLRCTPAPRKDACPPPVCSPSGAHQTPAHCRASRRSCLGGEWGPCSNLSTLGSRTPTPPSTHPKQPRPSPPAPPKHIDLSRLSKAAANMAAQLLALELQPLGVPLVAVHPGAVATDMHAQVGGRPLPPPALGLPLLRPGGWPRSRHVAGPERPGLVDHQARWLLADHLGDHPPRYPGRACRGPSPKP